MPTPKTRRTLAILDELTGVRHFTNEEAKAADARFRKRSDEWIKDPSKSSSPRVWDAQATFEWALSQPGNIFGFGKELKPWRRWAFYEKIGDRRSEYVAAAWLAILRAERDQPRSQAERRDVEASMSKPEYVGAMPVRIELFSEPYNLYSNARKDREREDGNAED